MDKENSIKKNIIYDTNKSDPSPNIKIDSNNDNPTIDLDSNLKYNKTSETKHKKKKKKYKDLMSSIMNSTLKSEKEESELHLESLKRNLGGGHFKKIDKI